MCNGSEPYRGPTKDHSCKVLSKSNQWFRWRCCLKKLFTDVRRTKCDHKSSPCHYVTGELKTVNIHPLPPYLLTLFSHASDEFTWILTLSQDRVESQASKCTLTQSRACAEYDSALPLTRVCLDLPINRLINQLSYAVPTFKTRFPGDQKELTLQK